MWVTLYLCDWGRLAHTDNTLIRETSFAHMARMATEVSKWIVDHVDRRRRYSPPKGQKLRKELRHERKALAGRYYQLLSGHAATGDYLCKIHKLPSDRCWCAGRLASRI